MSGYQTILRIRRLEELVDKLGMRMGNSKLGNYNYQKDFRDIVALFPRDSELPIYNRDAELFSGTLEELEVWLRGYARAQHYYQMLMGKNFENNVKRKEQDYRNKELLNQIKESNNKEIGEI